MSIMLATASVAPLAFTASPTPVRTSRRHSALTSTSRRPSRRFVPSRPTLCATPPPLPDVSMDRASEIRDGPFGLVAVALFRSVMQPEIGWKSPRAGYAGFVEECRMLLARKGPAAQQEVVFRTLDTLFQAPHGTSVFRRHFSSRPGFNAALTPIFFRWLVGPAQNNRPDEGGYGVHIEKCRFLDESGCKGLCVNMCQQPTQRYFTDILGLPVRMTPDYEDKSCQMTFGVEPLPLEEDPAVTGDCLVDCKMAPDFRRRSADATCYVNKGNEFRR